MRTRRKEALPPVGPSWDKESLYYRMRQFLIWLAEKNYSPTTITSREKQLYLFIVWCDERGLVRPQEVTRPVLERYQRYLYLYRKKNGEPLTTRSQIGRVVPIRAWFKWMTRQNYLLSNPAADLDLPRYGKRLPRAILTEGEAERVLSVPDIETAGGLRDRAILETFYSTGMRRMELAGLEPGDVDFERGTVMIRQGKGKKDRLIPIGERALVWIRCYLNEVRPRLVRRPQVGRLFVTMGGESLALDSLTELVRDLVKASGVGKAGSCHLFRHTMATLMLENGADTRFIQAMLGHAELNTTQIYTQVAVKKLKEVHTRTHPGAVLREELMRVLDAEALEEEDDEE